MGVILYLLSAAFGIVLWCMIVYFVVRAAAKSAIEQMARNIGHGVQLANAQADLLGRLSKHLTAQTDLMLAQAKHQGMTDAELAPVLQQVAERKAQPEVQLPFS